MRAITVTLVGCLAILITPHAWSNGCGNEGGSCGTVFCSPYETYCQCTDPGCNNPLDTDCISRAYCCEAFGNIGAR